jgi:multidrug resistance efflux pump
MHVGHAISQCPGCVAQAARNAALQQEIAGLHAEVTRLQAQVKTLQAQLSQTSANSHQPPSSDPPSRARVRVRELSTRGKGSGLSFCIKRHSHLTLSRANHQ